MGFYVNPLFFRRYYISQQGRREGGSIGGGGSGVQHLPQDWQISHIPKIGRSIGRLVGNKSIYVHIPTAQMTSPMWLNVLIRAALLHHPAELSKYCQKFYSENIPNDGIRVIDP